MVPHSWRDFGRKLYDLPYIGRDITLLVIPVYIGIPACLILVCHCACKCVIGPPFIIGLLIYKWRRRHLSSYTNIEDFLQSENTIMPLRYSYKEINKITKGFKIKIGKGGFGSVFKGQLRSGHDVAVKMLDKAKADGQEFISEVATLGRIHHVNVMQLMGYCVEGSKHALVYELMQNGSLDKYIFSKDDDNEQSLNVHQLYAISLGVARGIEYLHKGCNMQILHFDIKPHNILLDDQFIPKISDFGLARLYPANYSVVSLTAAQGTIGYMAPELFYRNVGGISYKADVYSFGMLLMEIAGRRKNLNVLADRSSQFYFSFWVYDQINEGNDVNIADATEEEMTLARKMMIVGLWCIQTKPGDRPSMNKVVEMLEGDEQDLVLPQKPYFYPQDLPIDDNNRSSSMGSSSKPEECSSMDEVVEMLEVEEEISELPQRSYLHALDLPTKSFSFNE
ncbi:rust resistance kinase Lr10-like isoform X2 [Prosopis cineraria]|uniref:rust resistance kinase Lr10-like isoform X2 n=1 Tax=Prosopis cineraria TaxID=364024 RepID=UPI00240FB171|nr:rust resistance kinase Lr10-like isoform X2 [Prosopis cineraria]